MGAVVEYYDIATNDEEAPLVLKIVIAPHTPNQVISVPLHQVINDSLPY